MPKQMLDMMCIVKLLLSIAQVSFSRIYLQSLFQLRIFRQQLNYALFDVLYCDSLIKVHMLHNFYHHALAGQFSSMLLRKVCTHMKNTLIYVWIGYAFDADIMSTNDFAGYAQLQKQ